MGGRGAHAMKIQAVTTHYSDDEGYSVKLRGPRVQLVSLNEYELERLARWYLAHLLAEENSRDDDRLAERLKGYES
jgi:hypothetical protein